MTTIRQETDKNCPDCLRTRPPAPQAITDTPAPVRCLSLNSRAVPWRPPLVRHPVHQDHEAQARRHSPRRHRSRICQRQPSGLQRRCHNSPPRSRLRRHHRTEHPRLPPCSRRQPRRSPAHQSQRRRARPAPATSSGPLLIPGGTKCTSPIGALSPCPESAGVQQCTFPIGPMHPLTGICPGIQVLTPIRLKWAVAPISATNSPPQTTVLQVQIPVHVHNVEPDPANPAP